VVDLIQISNGPLVEIKISREETTVIWESPRRTPCRSLIQCNRDEVRVNVSSLPARIESGVEGGSAENESLRDLWHVQNLVMTEICMPYKELKTPRKGWYRRRDKL
jgi:hypothetical protein